VQECCINLDESWPPLPSPPPLSLLSVCWCSVKRKLHLLVCNENTGIFDIKDKIYTKLLCLSLNASKPFEYCIYNCYCLLYEYVVINLRTFGFFGEEIYTPQWPWALCWRECELPVGSPMPHRLNGTGHIKCSPWFSYLNAGFWTWGWQPDPGKMKCYETSRTYEGSRYS
jgi:hypothetical protein